MLQLTPIIEEVQQLAPGVFAGGLAAALAWFRMRRVTARDNKGTTADDATAAVISMLRAEVQRLSDQNTKLAEIVNDLQMQVVALHTKNSELQEDIWRIKNVSQAS